VNFQGRINFESETIDLIETYNGEDGKADIIAGGGTPTDNHITQKTWLSSKASGTTDDVDKLYQHFPRGSGTITDPSSTPRRNPWTYFNIVELPQLIP
jgi:hypothetical protein